MAPLEYRASNMQRQFWLLWQLFPDGSAYNVPSLFHLRGPVDVRALTRSIMALADRHAVLRTTFVERDGVTLATIASALPPEVIVHPSPLEAGDPVIRRALSAPFDLRVGPLFRALIAPSLDGGHWLALTFHHVCMDLRSKALIASDLGALYTHFALGGPAPSLPVIAYHDIAREESDVVDRLEAEGGLDYFAQHLVDPPAALALPTDHARGTSRPQRGAILAFEMSPRLASLLRTRSTELRTKPFIPLLTTWAALLSRMTASPRLCVSVPFTNRRQETWQDVLGCFVNNLPLVVDATEASFDDLVARVRQTMLQHHRRQEIPLSHIVRKLNPLRDSSRNPIFQAGFTFEPPMDLRLENIGVESRKVHAGGTQLDVFLNLWESPSGFSGHIEYAAELFDPDSIARLGRNFLWLLQQALEHGDTPVSRLDFPEPGEKHQVVSGFNNTDVDFHAPPCLHDLFLAQANRTPTAVAVSMGAARLTYAELQARASLLATKLQALHVAPGDQVGVYMHRSLELPETLLAILLTGASYVPIDPEYPADRVRNMIEDARLQRVMAHAQTADSWPGDPSLLCRVESLSAEAREPVTVPAAATGGRAAYTIFTSGSTGRPKGATNTHAGIVNRILWMQAEYNLGSDDVVLQKTPYGFDVSTWEFFWPIVTGARLEMAPPGVHRDPLALATLIQTAGVTTVHFVPSMLQAFLTHPESRRCTGLRRIIASGEALPKELVKRCLESIPAPLFNLYGPTEAAVDVTAWSCQQDPERDPVPIGKPIANTRMYVLDRFNQPVPIGVPGEIFIGGVQVGAGYVNRPSLTAERFVADPFSSVPGARLYRTGDIGRWDPDGQLVYLGRVDHQVKIRGLRIELGEIESVLDRYPGIKQSVVVAFPPASPNASIIAYVAAPPSPTLASDLLAHAGKSLPSYMVPNQVIVLDALPLSANGKVDRAALPAPPAMTQTNHAPPRGELESWLAEEWARLLQVSNVSRDQNVFDLGGNSVTIATLAGRVRERLNIDVSLVRFFEFPTIESLASHLSSAHEKHAQPGQPSLDAAAERADRRRRALMSRPRT